MNNYPLIRDFLQTFFEVMHGLPEDFRIEEYANSASDSGKLDELKEELRLAFDDSELSWREMLFNKEYEAGIFASEEEARQHARRILWDPVM